MASSTDKVFFHLEQELTAHQNRTDLYTELPAAIYEAEQITAQHKDD